MIRAVGDYLFSKNSLTTVLQSRIQEAARAVEACAEDYILGVSEDEYARHIASEVALEVPELGEPFMLEPTEIDFDVGHDPMWGGGQGHIRFVKGCRVVVRVPFSGYAQLFFCQPSTFGTLLPVAEVHRDCISFAYDQPGILNAQEVKAQFERDLELLKKNLGWIQSDCARYSQQLESEVRQRIANRRSRLAKNREIGLSIGLPIRRRSDAPQTYAVPNVRRKPKIERPVVKEKHFAPEPALVEAEFEAILGILRNMVHVMERSPREFYDMSEEGLRSHFLVQLNGQYEGRASGETFNYQGKTDILIREGDRNVFIAECKIWKGEGELVRAVDQILGYLHWRDTKAALLIFNRNKGFSDVLAKIAPAVQVHKCCKRLIKRAGETEWRFLFHNPDDANRELQLSVMAFDIPKGGE